MSSVIPSAHGAVLAVLARTDKPLTGRQVADLTRGRVGRSRANEVLAELVSAGIVLEERYPPAKLYRLNSEHVAADPIVALAGLHGELLRRVREHAEGWAVPPRAVWLFGSAARGEGDPDSDIDLLVVRPDDVDGDDPAWSDQVSALERRIWLWSGNSCEVLELSEDELDGMAGRGERLVTELRADAVALVGASPRRLLRQRTAR